MNWQEKHTGLAKSTALEQHLEGDELKIATLLKKENEQSIDEMMWKLQINPNQLASTLLNMEFDGIVVSLPGKKYRLK